MLFHIIFCLIILIILFSILYKVFKKRYFQIILQTVFCGLIAFLIYYHLNSVGNKNTIPINNGYVFKGNRASVIELDHKKWLVSDAETRILINKSDYGYIYNFLTHFSTPDDVTIKNIESTNKYILLRGKDEHTKNIIYWIIICYDNSIYGPLNENDFYDLCDTNGIKLFKSKIN